MTNSPEILIIGAGPAGITAAWELARKGKKVLVVEKESQVGGLAKTMQFDEPEGTYLTDNGPHRFLSKQQYLTDMIADLLGDQWIKVPRLTRFFVGGKFYYYPVRFRNVLFQMGPFKGARVLIDYFIEHIRTRIKPRKMDSFEAFVVARFGRTLAEFNMINYTEKIWGIPASEISVDWAEQRIAGMSLWAAIKKMIFKNAGPKSLTSAFYYPKYGAGQVYETMKKEIEKLGGKILVNTEPVSIQYNGNKVTQVDFKGEDSHFSINPGAVISSVPVTHCIKLFNPQVSQEVQKAAESLTFRAQAYLFLTIDKEKVTDDNWVYFPDKNIPFGRLAEMKNFSKAMCPEGKTSLFIEFFCFKDDEIWNASKDELFAMAMDWLEKLKFLKREEVIN
ncbi:FAD-dependent oxidoreductase, partial [Patescibacteria group bacterium]|nr:FAD-dependent oxidoreductase [Patescibacteria group bacterium]